MRLRFLLCLFLPIGCVGHLVASPPSLAAPINSPPVVVPVTPTIEVVTDKAPDDAVTDEDDEADDEQLEEPTDAGTK
jgi:hypothetical protein